MQFVNLIEISLSGSPVEEMHDLPAVAAEACVAYVNLYNSVGFLRPWLGYLALQDFICIGTCGFKGPPENNRVEIAYFTFPEYEGRGYATRMASALIARGWDTNPDIIVAAQTLPNESASTAILRKLGFTLVGSITHPEDGDVWEWQLRNDALTAM
jgi:RimJ/RimL family protein N-acetyltransferase